MSIEDSLKKLDAAFNDVAQKIEQTYPNIWERASRLYTTETGEIDTQATVTFLTSSNHIGWAGKSLVQVAAESGEDAVKNYISHIEYGGYA